jgi:hypothetical protein
MQIAKLEVHHEGMTILFWEELQVPAAISMWKTKLRELATC